MFVQGLFQLLVEMAPVGQAGERIVAGELLRRIFGRAAGRHFFAEILQAPIHIHAQRDAHEEQHKNRVIDFVFHVVDGELKDFRGQIENVCRGVNGKGESGNRQAVTHLTPF